MARLEVLVHPVLKLPLRFKSSAEVVSLVSFTDLLGLPALDFWKALSKVLGGRLTKTEPKLSAVHVPTRSNTIQRFGCSGHKDFRTFPAKGAGYHRDALLSCVPRHPGTFPCDVPQQINLNLSPPQFAI
jgi:hypothetical protein